MGKSLENIDDFFAHDLLPESLQNFLFDSSEWAIASAFIAYAAGDAFGVAHEFNATPIVPVIDTLLGKSDWPYGGVSDDTALTLLTIQSMSEDAPEAAADRFLDLLREQQNFLRGLGPTTRFALGIPVKIEEQHLIGISNGGMMRTALLGMIFAPQREAEREAWITASVQATHKHPTAVKAALLMAALFSDAASNGDQNPLPTLSDWTVSPKGISLDPMDTYFGVVHVATHANTVKDAYIRACELGGDTDTVAALAGSLVAARLREKSELFDVGWLMDVKWSEIPEMKNAIARLINLRTEWDL